MHYLFTIRQEMKKAINGKIYYVPANLTQEQECIYCHIIDWKHKNITTERGVYKGQEYDAVIPNETPIPAMIYKPIIPQLMEMQQGKFAYKPHKFANQAVSSQTACINLFMPMLLFNEANNILYAIPGCPYDFKEIARDKLFKGFCFEYWGQDVKEGKGMLNDHSPQAGTDADVAISYYNVNNELCLWLIEHKLSEKEFTECGAYKSKANEHKENCTNRSLAIIADEPQKCYYHTKGYKYWDFLKDNMDKYQGDMVVEGCPFRSGLNQLWRNQMLAFALQETGTYKTVTFSVCHHAKNTMLERSINQYKTLTCNDDMSTSFTNYDVLDAIDTNDSCLSAWMQWYKEVYCF